MGIGRCRLLGILARIRSDEAYEILIESLSDSKVKGDAIEALGRFGNPKAISVLEGIYVDKAKYEYKAKNTALKRLRQISFDQT